VSSLLRSVNKGNMAHAQESQPTCQCFGKPVLVGADSLGIGGLSLKRRGSPSLCPSD